MHAVPVTENHRMRSAVDRAERYFCVRVSGFRIRRKPPGDVHLQQAVVQCAKCVPGYFSAVPQAGRPGFPGILIRQEMHDEAAAEGRILRIIIIKRTIYEPDKTESVA